MQRDGPAFRPDQKLPFFQQGQVFPDGHFGHAERFGQGGDVHAALRVQHVEDGASPFLDGKLFPHVTKSSMGRAKGALVMEWLVIIRESPAFETNAMLSKIKFVESCYKK